MSIVSLDDELIHYEFLGRGRPLFFLHGWVGSWRYWIPTMQAASSMYRTYAIDLWGFGDTPKRPEHYTLDEQVSLIGDFMHAMGIVKVPIVGHGLGAFVAMEFSLRHPDQVDRLMLTGLPFDHNAVHSRLKTATIDELAEWLLAKLPWAEPVRSEASKADAQAIEKSLAALQDLNMMEISERLLTPCLFVHGQNDPAIELPPQEMVASMSDQTHVVVFEESGHFPMLDQPSKFNRLLADFLSLSSGTSPRHLQLKEEWKRRIR